MVHSRSYTYIIKNVYSDPSEVFDTILDDEKVMSRASSVTESYDDFIQQAHQYDGSTMWDLAREGHTAGQYERRELKRKLYRAIANVNILEGIRFYVSFACSFAFGENKLMEGPRLRFYLLSQEMKANTWLSRKISSENGKKGMIQKWQLLRRKNNRS